MCLILFSIDTHPDLPLIVAANRDEFYRRPTHPAHYWLENPHLLAGKDLEAGGTWMGITKDGRFAAVTNFRDRDKNVPDNAKSRGKLVRDFLSPQDSNTTSARQYAERIINQGHHYAGFNLLVSDGKEFIYCNNQTNEIRTLTRGIYALSNHLLDTAWPKTIYGKNKLSEIINNTQRNKTETKNAEIANSLFELLQNKKPSSENELPKTGLDKNMEKLLSSIFIESENYGTCCSTAIIFHKNNSVYFHEKQFYSEEQKEKHKEEHSNSFNKESLNNDSVFQFTVKNLSNI